MPVPRAAVLLLGLVCVVVCGAEGCGSADDLGSAAQTLGPEASAGLSVTLTVDPYPPEVRAETLFLISIADEEGQPITGATVDLDMTMPAMPMPPNKPHATEEAPGRYTTPAVFTMAGAWEILIEVTTPQGKEARFTFAMDTR